MDTVVKKYLPLHSAEDIRKDVISHFTLRYVVHLSFLNIEFEVLINAIINNNKPDSRSARVTAESGLSIKR